MPPDRTRPTEPHPIKTTRLFSRVASPYSGLVLRRSSFRDARMCKIKRVIFNSKASQFRCSRESWCDFWQRLVSPVRCMSKLPSATHAFRVEFRRRRPLLTASASPDASVSAVEGSVLISRSEIWPFRRDKDPRHRRCNYIRMKRRNRVRRQCALARIHWSSVS